VTYQLITVT